MAVPCQKQVIDYLENYVDDAAWVIANITVWGVGCIEEQLRGGVPGLAADGVLEIARSDMAERYLLDVVKGHVMQYASHHLAHFLGRVSVKGEVLRKALKADAEYVFPNLLHMFLCFEDLAGDEYADQPLRRSVDS